jgi:hypothetical protein
VPLRSAICPILITEPDDAPDAPTEPPLALPLLLRAAAKTAAGVRTKPILGHRGRRLRPPLEPVSLVLTIVLPNKQAWLPDRWF